MCPLIKTKNLCHWDRKTAQQIKVLAAKPNTLGHTAEKPDFQKLSSNPQHDRL